MSLEDEIATLGRLLTSINERLAAIQIQLGRMEIAQSRPVRFSAEDHYELTRGRRK